MSDRQKHQIDPVDIFRSWARGLTPETIAMTYGLSRSVVEQSIESQLDERPALSQIDPDKFVRGHLVRIESLIDECVVVSARETGPARARAISVRFKALEHYFEVLQAIGILPQDLGDLGVHFEGVAAAKTILGVLRDHGTPERALEAIAEEIRLLGVGRPQ